jgi:hypothetical protein
MEAAMRTSNTVFARDVDLITEADDFDSGVRFFRIGFRMIFDHGSVSGTQLCASRFQIDARRQAAEQFSHAMDPASDHSGG